MAEKNPENTMLRFSLDLDEFGGFFLCKLQGCKWNKL